MKRQPKDVRSVRKKRSPAVLEAICQYCRADLPKTRVCAVCGTSHPINTLEAKPILAHHQ